MSILSWLPNRWFGGDATQKYPLWEEIVALSCDYMKARRARQWHGGKRTEGRKEEGRQCRPIHRRGERVMVSCCWPTLSDNWFLVCGSAWQDARRQEPSSAGRIPAVSRERRQPGRRVLLEWFYMGPSSSLVHLYPWLDPAVMANSPSMYLGWGLSLENTTSTYVYFFNLPIMSLKIPTDVDFSLSPCDDVMKNSFSLSNRGNQRVSGIPQTDLGNYYYFYLQMWLNYKSTKGAQNKERSHKSILMLHRYVDLFTNNADQYGFFELGYTWELVGLFSWFHL